MSPISSRNSVPDEASSNSPRFLSAAPVKAPFSKPNSSLSSRVSGMPPMLIAANGPEGFADRECRSLAITSLPVPLSPVTRTVDVVGATFSTSDRTACIFCPAPIHGTGGAPGASLPAAPAVPAAALRPASTWLARACSARSRRSRMSSSSGSKGFTR
jgi:hypothetical protein